MNEVSKNSQENNKVEHEKSTDENGGFIFSSAIKIHDPETNEVLLQSRGDD